MQNAQFDDEKQFHVKLVAENSLFPLHLAAVNHHYIFAAIVAMCSLTVYAVATAYQAKSRE